MPDNSRNTLIFFALMLGFVFAYQTFVLDPMQKRRAAEAQHAAQVVAQARAVGAPIDANGELIPLHVPRAQALAANPRLAIDTPALAGSIDLRGARLDDLLLKNYRETIAKTAPPVGLLEPEGTDYAYFAELGWQGANLPGMPTETTVWTPASQGPLTPDHPIVLTYDSGQGLTFTRQIAVDAKYLFTVTDTVANHGAASVTVTPYGSVQRRGVPPILGKNSIVHEGAIGMFDRNLKEVKYAKWKKDKADHYTSTGGWLGVTDKYWMTVLLPNQGEAINADFRVLPVAGVDTYDVSYVGQPRILPPGRQTVEVTHLFAGAKVVPILRDYGKAIGTPRFDDAVDWGFLEILTKPLFTVVEFYHHYVGNFGVAILLLTVTIRLVMFPLANQAYEMGTKMKKLQPQLKELQARFKDDAPGQQKEMMALYQREKINPVSGCIPILLQIPVFYSLTKLFSVTIEMRQAPFFGWVHDLSAPDPTTIWNLFGLIPWHVFETGWVQAVMAFPFVGGLATAIFHLSAWPILYAGVLTLSQSMTPMTGVDPTQQKMMQFMPLIFMFVLAQSAVGLVIYWTWSSIITIIQQYIIMRRFKVDNPVDEFFARFGAGKAAG